MVEFWRAMLTMAGIILGSVAVTAVIVWKTERKEGKNVKKKKGGCK